MTLRQLALITMSFFMMVLLGTVYSWSVFRVEVEDYFTVGAFYSGLPYMVSLFFYALSMMISGRLMHNDNTVKMMSVGTLLVGLGWIISGLVSGFLLFTLTYGVLIGYGVGMMYGVPLYIIQRELPQRRGLLMGIVLGGFGASPLIGAPMITFLLTQFTMARVFIMIGGLFIVIMSPTLLLFKTTKIKQVDGEVDPLFDKRLFFLVYLLFMFATAIGLMMIGLTMRVGVINYRFSTIQLASLMSLFALLNGLSRPIFGWIMDKKGFLYGASLSFVLIAFGALLALMNQGETLLLFTISFALFWFNLGAWLAMIPAMVRSHFGATHYARIFGNMFTAYGLGAIIGTMLSGQALEHLGTTTSLYIGILVVVAIGYIILGFIKKTH